MILETTFETSDGAVMVVDFMPLRDGESNVVRMVVGLRGSVAMKTQIILRFGYGSIVPWVSRLDDGTLRAIAGPDMIIIKSQVPVRGEGLTTVADFTVSEGERVSFVMTWGPSHLSPPKPVDPDHALDFTERFWTTWAAECQYTGEWRDAVMRSVLTLKALTYRPTGGIVAAPTTSLPEQIGGVRNWDYRYCWLRDATLTLLALMDAGYFREAAAWRDWLLRAVAGSPDRVQIMYGLSGERMLHEWEVPWLPGYENSKPVRIGNAAHQQLQLDVYGEVMDALHQARRGGLAETPEAWAFEKALLGQLEKIWQRPDQGIWETRGAPQDFTHSKVMAWVAFDRAIKSAEQFNLDGPLDRWGSLRDAIHEEVCRRAYDESIGAFVQSYRIAHRSTRRRSSSRSSAFSPPTTRASRARWRSIEKHLFVDGLVLRYDSEHTDDGLPAGEGAFLACSFWLADNYVLLGRRDDALRLFERLLSLRNDLGLLSEEYDPRLQRQVSNFPQAFSHIALLSTAFNLGHAEHQHAPRPAEQRPNHATHHIPA